MNMIFDTLKRSKTLQSDFTPQQEDALAQAIGSSTSDGLFTKADAALARVEILAGIGDLRDELREFRTSVAKDMAELRASVSNDIAGLRASTDKDRAELRASVSNDIAGLRASTDKDIAELRASVPARLQSCAPRPKQYWQTSDYPSPRISRLSRPTLSSGS